MDSGSLNPLLVPCRLLERLLVLVVLFRSLLRNGGISRRNALPAASIRGGHVRNGPRELDPSVQVQVVNCVTILVVVDVVWNSSSSAKHLGFLLGLDALGATGDTGFKERTVVTATVKLNLCVVESEVVEVGGKLVLSFGRAGRTSAVECRTISVVDLDSIVGRSHHVEVEEKANLVLLRLRELLDVVLGSQQTRLLTSPPGEANGVVDRELCQLDGNLEDRHGARSVIVDSRTCSHGIRVATDMDDVVVVASNCLGDNVVGCGVLDICGEINVDVNTSLELRAQRFSLAQSDTADRYIGILRVLKLLERVALEGSLAIVRCNYCSGTLGSCESDLDTKRTGSTANEGDGAVEGLGEVRLLTISCELFICLWRLTSSHPKLGTATSGPETLPAGASVTGKTSIVLLLAVRFAEMPTNRGTPCSLTV